MAGRLALPFLLLLLTLGRPALAADDPYAALASALVRGHVIPAEEAFAGAAGRLEAALSSMACPADEAALEPARAAFHDAMDAWMGIQHIRFGPVTYLMRDSRLYFWPDKTNALSRQLGETLAESNPALLDPETLKQGSVALQGLPALERLLYPGEDPAGEPVYRCRLMAALGVNVAEMARGLLHDWRDGERPFAMLVEAADSDDTLYEDSHAVIAQFVGSLNEALLALDEVRLARPLGEPGGRARPRRAESWRSGRSARNARLILEALNDMVAPASGTNDGREGLAGLLREVGHPEVAQGLTARLDQAKGAARALGDNLAEAVVDEARRPLVESLRADVREARNYIASDVAPALGITLGFNAMDGD